MDSHFVQLVDCHFVLLMDFGILSDCTIVENSVLFTCFGCVLRLVLVFAGVELVFFDMDVVRSNIRGVVPSSHKTEKQAK